MLRRALPIIFAVCLCLGGGSLSAHYALRHFGSFGTMQIGAWQTDSHITVDKADPYARAKTGRSETISFGQAEGIRFSLDQDINGKPLNGSCRYILEGEVPEARFFTLYPINENGQPLKSKRGLPDALFSQNIIREETGAFRIMLSSKTEAGNWLFVPEGPYILRLNLYDTPITTMTGLIKPIMPQAVKLKGEHCD